MLYIMIYLWYGLTFPKTFIYNRNNHQEEIPNRTTVIPIYVYQVFSTHTHNLASIWIFQINQYPTDDKKPWGFFFDLSHMCKCSQLPLAFKLNSLCYCTIKLHHFNIQEQVTQNDATISLWPHIHPGILWPFHILQGVYWSIFWKHYW